MIAGGHVALVPLDRPHLARTRAWANDPELARLLNRERPVSEAEHEAWFNDIRTREDCRYFAVELRGGGHVGNVWLWNIEPRHRKAELRVVIGDPAARGRRVGTEAIDLLCRHGFAQMHLHRIYAYVLAFNVPAKRAFERAGFVLEGTLRDDRWSGDRFVDAYMLSRLTAP